MAETRGGLHYDIQVRDDFSKQLGEFRTGIRGAISDARALKAEMGRGGRAVRALAGGTNQAGALAKENAKVERERLRAEAKAAQSAAALVKVQQQSAAKQAAIAAQSAAQQQRIQAQSNAKQQLAAQAHARRMAQIAAQGANVAASGQARQQAALNLQALRLQGQLQLQNNKAALQAQALAARQAAAQQRAIKSQNDLGKAINRTSRDAARAVPIFNGMFTAILVSEAVRGGIDLVQQFISTIISSNAQIQEATLGLASLFTAVGDVRDVTGSLVKGPEALNTALGLAVEQVKELRKEALLAPGTFEDILNAFQTGLAPGLVAGLQVSEIRKLAVRISQAAASIGLPQNQLAEEVRSLLSGNITARNTRIATALGITNEDIRTAQEAGNLAEFLTEKFEAFGVAAGKATENFTLRIEKLRDSIQFLLQTGGEEFFNRVSDAVARLSENLVFEDAFGNLQATPEALEALKGIVDGLTGSFERLTAFAAEFGASDLPGIGRLIGNAFLTATDVVLGIADALRTLVTVVQALAAPFTGSDPGIRDLAKLVTLLAAFAAVAGPLASVIGLLRALAPAATPLIAVFRSLFLVVKGGALKALLSGVLALGSAGAAAATGLGAAVVAVAALVGYAAKLALEIKATNDRAAELNAELAKPKGRAITAFTEATSALSDIQRELFDTAVASSQLQKVFREGSDAEIAQAYNTLAQAAQGNSQALVELVTKYRASTDAVKDFAASGELGGAVFADFTAGLKAAEASATNAIGRIRVALSGTVTGPSASTDFTEQIERAAENVEKLRDALAKAQDENTFALDDKVQRDLAQVVTQRIQIQTDIARLQDTVAQQSQGIAARLQTAATSDAAIKAAIAQDRARIEADLDALRKLRDEEAARRNVFTDAIDALSRSPTDTPEQVATVIESFNRLQEQAEQSGDRIESLSASIRASEQSLTELEQNARGAADGVASILATLSPEEQLRAAEALEVLTAAQGQLAQKTEELAAATQVLDDLISKGQRAVALQVETAATKDLAKARDELAASQDKLAAAEDAADLAIGAERRNATQQAFLENSKQIAANFREQLTLQTRIQQIEDERIRRLGQIQGDSPEAGSARDTVNAAADAEIENVRNEARSLAADYDVLAEKERILRERMEAPVSTGIKTALEEIIFQFDAFATTLELTKKVVEDFASFSSNAIVDAFDPTADVNLKERFARFLQDIAREMINTFIKIAVAKAALGLVSLFGGGGAAAGAAAAGGGFHQGGKVGRGYASGGAITPGAFAAHPFGRPAGLHPADTVPIWAQTGEYIIPKKAADSLGGPFLEALRQGRLDLGLLGLPKTRRPGRAKVGYATGGSVSGGQAAVASASAAAPALVPVLVANDQTFEKLASNAPRGYSRVQSRNSRQLRAVVSGA